MTGSSSNSSYDMRQGNALAIETCIRQIAGNSCERSDFINADLIRPDCAQWLALYSEKFPAKVQKSETIKAWHRTAVELYSKGESLDEDQVLSFIADLEKEVRHS